MKSVRVGYSRLYNARGCSPVGSANMICGFPIALGYSMLFHRQGTAIKSFRAAWASTCKAVGLEGKVFHDFRRTTVRNMVRAGIPERVAQPISGDKTGSIFDRFHIVSDSDLREAAKRQTAYVTNEMVTKTVTVDAIEQSLGTVTRDVGY
jgi:hypothetical protein